MTHSAGIEPAFPYDVYDPTPEGEFQHTEEQLNHLAQMIRKTR